MKERYRIRQEGGQQDRCLDDELKGLEQTLSHPARTYKDRIFRMLFRERQNALELYNAMNGTAYNKPEELIITTLDNAIYMGMKNDVSFILYDQLMLYEHQSTCNPNMPLRNLMYVTCIYARLTEGKNLYGSSLVRLPEPRFVVFYNGKAEVPEKYEQKLSDVFESRTLQEYMLFVDTVRKYEKNLPFVVAMEAAIEECINKGVLEKFLREKKAEVLDVGIFEYNEEKHLEQERSEAEKRGIELGEERLGRLISCLMEEGKSDEISVIIADKEKREAYYRKYQI